jgi:DNA polymerase-4
MVADLQRADESDLMKRYGVEGRRLWRLSRGIDERVVNPERETKSVSAETTFGEDIAPTSRWKKSSGRCPSACRRG